MKLKAPLRFLSFDCPELQLDISNGVLISTSSDGFLIREDNSGFAIFVPRHAVYTFTIDVNPLLGKR
jgi:hypothetical protein